MGGRSRLYVGLLSLLVSVGWAQNIADPVDGSEPAVMNTGDRLAWITTSTLGPSSLAGGMISAGWCTLRNKPEEYGSHWAGFGLRNGMRVTGLAASNTIEASLGSIWGEDPRYSPAPGSPFKTRVLNIVKKTVLATGRTGQTMPAYSRFAAIPASNFLSNTWRPDSEATAHDALIRTGLGFAGRMASNAFAEFWPDVRSRLFH
jgi:hypothetical protein